MHTHNIFCKLYVTLEVAVMLKYALVLRISHYCALDHSCNKYCDLIGQEEVSISHINL